MDVLYFMMTRVTGCALVQAPLTISLASLNYLWDKTSGRGYTTCAISDVLSKRPRVSNMFPVELAFSLLLCIYSY
jgi:hypothetical protein